MKQTLIAFITFIFAFYIVMRKSLYRVLLMYKTVKQQPVYPHSPKP